jgi:hypothetical protein
MVSYALAVLPSNTELAAVLRRLEQMGLAEERTTGVWAIDPQLETKLRSLAERGDIMVTMNRVMRAHGIDRPAGDFGIFSGARKSGPVIGRVVEAGIADEMTDRKYLVVDGIDGRIHYAETGKLAGHDIPDPGMIVALSGGGGKAKMRNARIEVVSYWPVERLASAEAATWLDQVIVAEAKPVIHEKGFGAEVSTALIAREHWLIVNRHARVEQPGTITPKPDMLRHLNHRGLKVAAEKLSAQMAMPHVSPFEGMRITGKHVGTIDVPMRRLAVIKGRQEFTLVRWRPELLKMRGKDIEISVQMESSGCGIRSARPNLQAPKPIEGISKRSRLFPTEAWRVAAAGTRQSAYGIRRADVSLPRNTRVASRRWRHWPTGAWPVVILTASSDSGIPGTVRNSPASKQKTRYWRWQDCRMGA